MGLGLQERWHRCGTKLKRWGCDKFQKFGRDIEITKNELDGLKGMMGDDSLDRVKQLDVMLHRLLN